MEVLRTVTLASEVAAGTLVERESLRHWHLAGAERYVEPEDDRWDPSLWSRRYRLHRCRLGKGCPSIAASVGESEHEH